MFKEKHTIIGIPPEKYLVVKKLPNNSLNYWIKLIKQKIGTLITPENLS